MSKYIIIGIFITLVGISLDAIAVRSRGRRQNLLALFIMAVGCSVIVQIISQNMTTLYARILGGGLLLAGIILRFGNIKFTWLNLGDNESGSNSGGVSWRILSI